MRTRDGRIITGVNIDAYLGRMAVCAEAIAIGRVDHRDRRQGHRDHRRGAPSAAARSRPEHQGGVALRLLPRTDPRLRSEGAGDRAERAEPSVVSIGELLPNKYSRGQGVSAQRLVSAERREDDVAEASLRPQKLAEFIGQEKARANLDVFIKAARARNEALDHVLFVGPPGLGKTTLAQIVARELGVNFRATSGPVISKAGDLAALLTNLEERDVLFIDEIHRLNPQVEEILYPAMEDFQLDLIIGEGPAARSVKIELAKFTLVGATTRAGLLTNPLRDRFGIPVRLDFYNEGELEQIVTRGARVLGVAITKDGANEIARRSRGTPRIAGRLLRRLRDFADVARRQVDRPRRRRQGARRARSRCRRARRDGPALSVGDRAELRRRAGRGRNHRGGACRSRAMRSRTSSSRS